MRTVNPSKAAGPGGITGRVLKDCGPSTGPCTSPLLCCLKPQPVSPVNPQATASRTRDQLHLVQLSARRSHIISCLHLQGTVISLHTDQPRMPSPPPGAGLIPPEPLPSGQTGSKTATTSLSLNLCKQYNNGCKWMRVLFYRLTYL